MRVIGSTTPGGVVKIPKQAPDFSPGVILAGEFIRRFPGLAAAQARRNKAAEFIPRVDSGNTAPKKYYLPKSHKFCGTTNQITSII